jgi:hypothetical protein
MRSARRPALALTSARALARLQAGVIGAVILMLAIAILPSLAGAGVHPASVQLSYRICI